MEVSTPVAPHTSHTPRAHSPHLPPSPPLPLFPCSLFPVPCSLFLKNPYAANFQFKCLLR
ncbi:hypothetical protein [Moorena sp. SIOASIH]|uniref:hypothetical protein n=1 Tax=Moorena sp. SIOASIH TaxID=2607817 RepID=UPI0025E6F463|nr:hypothetical protein [Moorena sp. SIOASIH]